MSGDRERVADGVLQITLEQHRNLPLDGNLLPRNAADEGAHLHPGCCNLWNVPLLQALKRLGLPVIHTIHDLVPHARTGSGPHLHLWNSAIVHHANRILVHAEQYRNRLLGRGLPAWKVHHPAN